MNQTNAAPATNGGFLLDSTKLVGYVAGGGERFRIDLSGTDAGDVHLGNYAGNQGVFWDQSAGVLAVRGTISADDITAGNNISAKTFQTAGTRLTQATVGSDGTVYVADTTLFPSDGVTTYYGWIYDTTVDLFAYTGKTATTLTGCTGVLAHASGLAVGGQFKRMIVSSLDNEMHFFGDRGDGTHEELASIGVKSSGGDYVVGYFGSIISGCSRIGLYGQSYSNIGIYGQSYEKQGVYGVSTEYYGVHGSSYLNWGVFGYSEYSYGGRFSVSSVNGKAPLLILPSASATAPTHTSDAGAMWITSTGIPYHNMGTTTWYETVLASLKGSFVWDPGSIANGAGGSTNITITGAAFGDAVIIFPPYDMQNIILSAFVQAADTVTVLLFNVSGGAKDLASGTWKYKIIKY